MKIVSPRGFTLIELMIVMAILGIMATIALPNYRSYLVQRRLNATARQVMSDLMLARTQAISLNRDVQVSFSTTPASQYTYDAGAAAAVKNLQASSGLLDVTVSASTNPIFSSNGTARNTAATNPVSTITLSNAAGSKTVTVNVAGRIKID